MTNEEMISIHRRLREAIETKQAVSDARYRCQQSETWDWLYNLAQVEYTRAAEEFERAVKGA